MGRRTGVAARTAGRGAAWAAWAAALTLAVGGLAGCGAGGGNGGVVTAPSGGPAPIVIGNIGSYSGPVAASEIAAKKVIVAWAKTVNAAGGIDGHRITLIQKDDTTNVATALQAVKELVEKDKVVAIVDDQSYVDESWAGYVRGKGIPVIGGANLNTQFLVDDNFFAAGSTAIPAVYGSLVAARRVGPTFGLLYCAEVPLCAEASVVLGIFGPRLGLQIPVIAPVAQSASDYTAVCQRLKASRVDTYEVATASDVALRVYKQCRAQGVTALPIANGVVVTQAWTKEPAVNGALTTQTVFPFVDTSVPATRAYQTAIARYAPDLGASNGPTGAEAWTAGKLFEKAVVAGGPGPVTSAGIIRGLHSLRGETLGGLTPPLTFPAGSPTQVSCYFTMGLSNGRFTEPRGLHTDCAPPSVLTQVLDRIRG